MLTSCVKINGYNPFKALMIREYWENRRAIFTTPLVITALSMGIIIISMGIFGRSMHINGNVFTLQETIANMSTQNPRDLSENINQILLASSTPIMIGVWFGMVFTALGSLYDERKDKSILFWKSMPVSDFQTILSKLLTVTLVIPLVAIGFAFIFQIFLLIVGTFATFGTQYSSWDLLWSAANLPAIFLREVVFVIVYSLWALPVLAWLMLASVTAKRSPLLLASIPVVLFALFEALFFQTRYLLEFVINHLSGGKTLNPVINGENINRYNPRTVLEIIQTTSQPTFWLGMVIAAGLLYLTIQLRKRNSL